METTPNTLRKIAEREGFSPTWLFEHVRSCIEHPPSAMDTHLDPASELELGEIVLALGRRAIAAIHLANFKAFGPKPQRFPLAPLTFIFGPNSAGKSSLLHALLYAQHSVANDTIHTRHPQGAGTLVDLGRFDDIVHGHDSDATVQIGIEFAHLLRSPGPDSRPLIWWVALRRAAVVSASLEHDGKELLHFLPDTNTRGVLRCVRGDTQVRLFQSVAELAAIDPRLVLEWHEWSPADQRDAIAAMDHTIRTASLRLRGVLPHEISWTDSISPSRPSKTDQIRIDLQARLRLLFRQTFDQAEYFLRCIDYLSPVRKPPGRDFENIDKSDVNHGHNGGSSWLKLAEMPDVRARLNRWFGALQPSPDSPAPPNGIAHYRFDVENNLNQIAVEEAIERVAHDYLMEKRETHEQDRPKRSDDEANQRFYFPFDQLDATDLTRRIREDLTTSKDAIANRTLTIRDLRIGSQPKVSPAEIGVGIQYLIPVLVEGFAGGAPLQIVEEPELHAHPALQAELGDVFLEGALAHPKKSWCRSFIVETHSEALILRVLRRIRETKLGKGGNRPAVRPEDVALIYVDPSKSGAIIRPIRVDDQGRIRDRVPGGFFEEDFKELFN